MPRSATATPTTASFARIRWRAPTESGVGHAYPDGKARPAACREPWTHPRFDWPVRVKCANCVAALTEIDREPVLPPRHPRR